MHLSLCLVGRGAVPRIFGAISAGFPPPRSKEYKVFITRCDVCLLCFLPELRYCPGSCSHRARRPVGACPAPTVLVFYHGSLPERFVVHYTIYSSIGVDCIWGLGFDVLRTYRFLHVPRATGVRFLLHD